MKTLVAFTLLVAAALAEPQYFYSGVVPHHSSFYGGVYPYSSGMISPVVGSPVVAKTMPYVTPYAAVAYPAQDTSRGLPQPVQDTPEVKAAKGAFAAEYAQAVARNTGAPVVPVHSIQKRAAVLPAGVLPYKTPASTSPLVYSAAAPVISAYNYGSYPYTYGAYPAYNSYSYGY